MVFLSQVQDILFDIDRHPADEVGAWYLLLKGHPRFTRRFAGFLAFAGQEVSREIMKYRQVFVKFAKSGARTKTLSFR